MNPRRPSLRHLRSREPGQALVELAIVLPLLIFMLLGLVDLGRVYFAYIALEEAVHEGAMYASRDPTSTTVVTSRVRTSSNHDEVVNATVSAVACSTTPAPGTISVTAFYDLALLTPVGSELFGGHIRLSATVTGTNLAGSC